ncbi:hypothetical protein DPX16_8912 [Anabarilius grahami]|uniref:Uncharacterized protein n=1 Tax=Anabarilius grahami TaxID=495550 RepID=A0A3N0ZA69_ANAGA|nr:hypothetical protein DPX16_8912 [Anabarilius grahami]
MMPNPLMEEESHCIYNELLSGSTKRWISKVCEVHRTIVAPLLKFIEVMEEFVIAICRDAPVEVLLKSYLSPGVASSVKAPSLPIDLACSALEGAECALCYEP